MDWLESSTLVVLSGGQDSTTCLYWAKKYKRDVRAVFFDYGQRHLDRELTASTLVALKAGIKLDRLWIPDVKKIADSDLLNYEGVISPTHPMFLHLPGSFVPLRNMILFTHAAALAVKYNYKSITVGVNDTDFSGYPDCRPLFIHSLKHCINAALGISPFGDSTFDVVAPLQTLTKTQIVKLAIELNCLDALAETHTCYAGVYPPCTLCPSCKIRAEAFLKAGVPDPLIERAKREGKL